jgi:hypothetical protein
MILTNGKLVLVLLSFACFSCSSSRSHPEGDDGGQDVRDAAASDGVPEIREEVPSVVNDAAGDIEAQPDAMIPENLCADMRALGLQIDCPNEPTMAACVADCVGLMSACIPETEAYFNCFVASGTQGLACNPDVGIVLREGLCVTESDAYINCVERQP